ncbi:C69 family dipeptidase [Teichococcus oryzae]|uniref:C69 family dipeptidase n=1 Tax=Teichococcus oryzae TaxID=1608942 RepID=UPI0019D5BDEE|nr:C69 family dipeptidase [Pseudoroseomonas oryzae]
MARLRRPVTTALLVAAAWLAVPRDADASYGFYVGKNLTADGSVLLGGTGEEVSGHWLEIVPRRKHAPGDTVTVGVTDEASIPGKLTTIPQVPETFRYLTMNYSDYQGFPAPLTNGGLNEHGVAIRDIWSTSRRELIEMTPRPQQGPQYSDLARIALERARTAREAVEIIGRLIDEHGYSTYGGNSHLIADKDEGWVVLQFAGGKGLWAAERLGPDEVRASYPGYIGEFPPDYRDNPDFMGSANLISFAEEQGWHDRAAGKPFNIHGVYSRQDLPMRSGAKFWAIEEIEAELRAAAPMTPAKMMKMVRDPRIADEEAGYGQVAHLRGDVRPELNLVWVAPTGSVTAPFIPWHLGAEEVPPEFGIHRYLYRNAGAHFLNPAFQSQEATEFAGRLFKRLMYHTCARPETFLPEVTAALEAFEGRMLAEIGDVQRTADILYARDEPALGSRYLSFYSRTRAMEGMRLGHDLLASVETRSKLIFGIPAAPGGEINSTGGETPNCLVGHDPDQPRR